MKKTPNSNNEVPKCTEALFQEMRHLPPYEQRDTETCSNLFDEEVIEGWYRARQYVLYLLEQDRNMGAEGINPSSSDHVHVVIHYNNNPLALYIARQVALVAHFPNFKEGDEKENAPENCTKITILYNRNKHSDILEELKKEEYLCNLPHVCKCVLVDGNTGEDIGTPINGQSYIDIELELVAYDKEEDFCKYPREEVVTNSLKPVIVNNKTLQEISQNEYSHEIDIRTARRVNMAYKVGADIDNLPPDDPNTAERYEKALLYFCYQQPQAETERKWEELCSDKEKDNTLAYQINLRNKLSNVFCSDCFSTRMKSVIKECKRKRLHELLQNNEKELSSDIKKNLQVLAQCEHARWNVEKLILGFFSYTAEEQWRYTRKFGSERSSYRKTLKDKGHHINLCSYHDLRRIDPGNKKYDCFLMLAMVRILKENIER